MNNGTKKANIMSWQTFKKKFNPQLIYATDNTFGTKSIIEPTMRRIGFNVNILFDIAEDKKPLEVLSKKFNLYEFTYIIYHPWTYRDGSGKAISVFYK